ncbi:hypothetical protein [Acetobacter estunensis]|uniref:hypothetical protein n=1 Tax=Acetobacter estunensis TaxID=104097 RepID=UPI001C2CE0BF|nr:hypothetical protein [Acetobacter estunensis]MBV1837252.1 hypothetical protein [Acetobacter estunensis]
MREYFSHSLRDRGTVLSWLVLFFLPIVVHLPELIGGLQANGLTSDPMNVLSVGTAIRRNWLMGGFIPGLPGWIDGCAGAIVQALGRLVARDWLQGILPLWNPYSGVGMPLAGEYQPGAFFLPFVLLLGLPCGLLLLKISLQIVAGFAMYAFLRALGIGTTATLIGGILWAFNGTFAWASDGPSQPLAFLPLALLGVEKVRQGKGWHGWEWLATGLAGLLLCSFPETAFLEGTLVLCWALLRFGQEKPSERIGFTLRIIAGGGVALLIAAPQLVSFATYLPSAWVGNHNSVTDEALPLASWIMSFLPYVNGSMFYGAANQYAAWWGMGGFWGLTVTWMALFSVITALCGPSSHRTERFVLAAYFLACVAKQANIPGLASMVDLIPGVGRTVFYRLCYPSEEMVIIILAVFALDDLKKAPRDQSFFVPLLGACVVLGTALCVAWSLDHATREDLAHFQNGPLSTRNYHLFSLLLGCGSLSVMILALLCRNWERRCAIAGITMLGEILVLFCIPFLSLRPALPMDKGLLGTMRELIGFTRFVSMGTIMPNYGAYYGLASINHNGVPMPMAWIKRLRRDFGPDVDPVTFDGITPQHPDGRFFVLPVLESHPEIFEKLSVSLVVVPHGVAFQRTLPDSPTLIYSSMANDLYRFPHPAPYFEAGNTCTADIWSRDHVRVKCSAASSLIRRELMMAGWTASLNGKITIPDTEDELFQRIKVPAGETDVTFSFSPPGMMRGWGGMAIGLMALGCSAVFGRRSRCQIESNKSF